MWVIVELFKTAVISAIGLFLFIVIYGGMTTTL